MLPCTPCPSTLDLNPFRVESQCVLFFQISPQGKFESGPNIAAKRSYRSLPLCRCASHHQALRKSAHSLASSRRTRWPGDEQSYQGVLLRTSQVVNFNVDDVPVGSKQGRNESGMKMVEFAVRLSRYQNESRSMRRQSATTTPLAIQDYTVAWRCWMWELTFT